MVWKTAVVAAILFGATPAFAQTTSTFGGFGIGPFNSDSPRERQIQSGANVGLSRPNGVAGQLSSSSPAVIGTTIGSTVGTTVGTTIGTTLGTTQGTSYGSTIGTLPPSPSP